MTKQVDRTAERAARPSVGRIRALREALDFAYDLLDRYRMIFPLCDCEPCERCDLMPKNCSGTTCSLTCQCSECDCCRIEACLAQIEAARGSTP